MTDPTTPDSDQRFGSTVEDIYESTFVAEPNSRSVPLVEEVEVDDREWLSEFPRRYQLIGTQFDDEFNVGARLLNAETSRPSLMPDEVYDSIVERLTAELDLESVRERTTNTVWVAVGHCTIERASDGSAELRFELWDEWQP